MDSSVCGLLFASLIVYSQVSSCSDRFKESSDGCTGKDDPDNLTGKDDPDNLTGEERSRSPSIKITKKWRKI